MLPETSDTTFHHPDMKDDDLKNGLMCFLQMDRVCGPDCMAFAGERPEGHEYIGQWASCRVLTCAHKGAKHLTILATVAGQLLKTTIDEQRRTQPMPPVPRGPAL